MRVDKPVGSCNENSTASFIVAHSQWQSRLEYQTITSCLLPWRGGHAAKCLGPTLDPISYWSRAKMPGRGGHAAKCELTNLWGVVMKIPRPALLWLTASGRVAWNIKQSPLERSKIIQLRHPRFQIFACDSLSACCFGSIQSGKRTFCPQKVEELAQKACRGPMSFSEFEAFFSI